MVLTVHRMDNADFSADNASEIGKTSPGTCIYQLPSGLCNP